MQSQSVMQNEDGGQRQFLFGQPVCPALPVANGPRKLFILGAYPSALHVRWTGPKGERMIRAVAVDNEPEPFWSGHDQEARIKDWKVRVGFRDGDWGYVELCGSLNGPSGSWVENEVLKPLGVLRTDTWITDCLDTYFESEGASRRMGSEPIAEFVRIQGIPPRHHHRHPSEDEIVRMAFPDHKGRLTAELRVAEPDRVVTLGNAALRVFAKLTDLTPETIKTLSVDGYGQQITVTIGGREVEWIPLAHPAAPARFQEAHKTWVEARQRPVE